MSKSQQVQDPLDVQEISKKGQQILEALPEHVRRDHEGKFVAIEVGSEDYFIGDTAIEATRKAQAEHPNRVFFLGRIGYRTAYTFKGRR